MFFLSNPFLRSKKMLSFAKGQKKMLLKMKSNHFVVSNGIGWYFLEMFSWYQIKSLTLFIVGHAKSFFVLGDGKWANSLLRQRSRVYNRSRLCVHLSVCLLFSHNEQSSSISSSSQTAGVHAQAFSFIMISDISDISATADIQNEKF